MASAAAQTTCERAARLRARSVAGRPTLSAERALLMTRSPRGRAREALRARTARARLPACATSSTRRSSILRRYRSRPRRIASSSPALGSTSPNTLWTVPSAPTITIAASAPQ
jgi:hypothetical protein